MLHAPLHPQPLPSVRPWAGHRLAPARDRVGELWLAGPDSIVATGSGSMTLDALAAMHGAALVGEQGMALLGARFPLLVKLIDSADWLSLQVHPDDLLAHQLYGPAAVGKAEAWVVVDAAPDSHFVTRPAAGLAESDLRSQVADGTLGLDGCSLTPARPGDVLLLEPGTIHAIGPGALVYEIEQPSDLTFRISDWGRPTGRPLHTSEALKAIRPGTHAIPAGRSWTLDGGSLRTPVFTLELERAPSSRTPGGRSLEIVSPLVGGATVRGDGWLEHLVPWQTLVLPAGVEGYDLVPADGSVVAVGSLR